MRSYYARWADTGRPVYRLSRAGHLKKRRRRFLVPSSLPSLDHPTGGRNGCEL